MPIIMARVDERLIHGQMALSWLRSYDVDAVVVIDDDSAHDDMKTMLLEMAVSGRISCLVCDEGNAKQVIESNNGRRLFLCTGKPSAYLHLLEQGVPIPQVNIGGLYDKPGRKQLYKTIFIDDALKADILALEKFSACKVEYREVPQNAPVDILSDLKK